MVFHLHLRTGELITLPKPAVMGVINISPNSFINAHQSLDAALQSTAKMVEQGVDIIDLGAVATNPKIKLTTEIPNEQLEMDRLIPLVEAVRKRFEVLISVDTSRAEIMRAAVAAGADMINDQRALTEKNALQTVAELKTPVCLMHFFAETRQPGSCSFAELMQMIKRELLQRVQLCEQSGITRDKIILDPGFGQGNYAKNADENFYLLAHLNELIELGFPLLSAWSRKSMIGDSLNAVPEDRLFGSIAADTLATFMGAHILRGHDVKATADAIKITQRVIAMRDNKKD